MEKVNTERQAPASSLLKNPLRTHSTIKTSLRCGRFCGDLESLSFFCKEAETGEFNRAVMSVHALLQPILSRLETLHNNVHRRLLDAGREEVAE